MLLENERHKKYHTVGPADMTWGGKEKAVASVTVTRSTIDNEQVSFACPIFEDDTRESLDLRLGMFFSLAQDRMEDANEAWRKTDEEHQAALEAAKESNVKQIK